MLTIEEAMQIVRNPKILHDDRKLRAILVSVFQAGRDSVEDGVAQARHGVIRFNDGTLRAI